MPHLSRVPDILSTGNGVCSFFEYSYELLLQYLHKTQSITMLGIINEHVNFQVSPGQRSSISDDEGVTLVGSGQDAANLINQKEIHWGMKE
ncbi:Transcription initiation factor TFIID subunit 5 [Camellia lanceoleosa]|uniref:Transcription initiation factor TFIID subunit 5 n=1 Tax=Camellia lanceoleosa TaxID=1840588 RepID=A0ACC0GMW3_9ERIC|nr:Transcription initiation factor TFIID subunit 5 [Camellia lanceoleosa]